MAHPDRRRLPAPVKETGGKRPFAEPGTALANIPSIESEGFTRQSTGWGGARNRRDRASWHLTRQQCERLIAATDYAVQLGLGFNRHWTVHYERAGIASIDAPAFVTRLLKLVRDYVARKKGQFTAVWVREDGEGKGGHVHILMHLPAACQLRGRSRHWVKLAGGTYRKKVSRVRSIGGQVGAAASRSKHYEHNLREVLGYLLKCASSEVGEALGLPRYGEGGLILGKRSGRTQNLGSKARHTAPILKSQTSDWTGLDDPQWRGASDDQT